MDLLFAGSLCLNAAGLLALGWHYRHALGRLRLNRPRKDMGKGVFIGDSRIQQWRRAAGFNERDITNLGQTGETSFEVLQRLDQVFDKRHPSFVLVEVGINDFDVGRKFGLDVDTIVQGCFSNLSEIAQRLSSRSVPAVVCTVVPVND